MKFISRIHDTVMSTKCDGCGMEGALIYTLHKDKRSGYVATLENKTLCVNCYAKCSQEYDYSNLEELKSL